LPFKTISNVKSRVERSSITTKTGDYCKAQATET
jgi:hypothetical protein